MDRWEYLQPWDEQIHAALTAGDLPRAWQSLILGYQHVVVGYCVTLLGNQQDGEDVAHDVFVDAYAALSRFQQRASLRTWVFAIARKKCLKHGRGRLRLARLSSRQRELLLTEAHLTPSDSPELERLAVENTGAQARTLEQLSMHLKRLTRRERDVLLMYHLEELSYRNIAQRLWVSETTARRRVQAATARLKQLLHHEGE
ncbi:MAG: RNA polymerase sigma factor [Candidatus Tectimicrobiota bacterium]